MQRRMLQTIGCLVILVLAMAVAGHAADDEMTPLDIPMIGDMEALPIGSEVAQFEVKDVAGEPYAFIPSGPGARVLVFWSIF